MTPKTVKSGIFLPNLTTFIPLFFITFKIIYNFNILQIIFFHFSPENRKIFSFKGTESAFSPETKRRYQVILLSKNKVIGGNGDFNMREKRREKGKKKVCTFLPNFWEFIRKAKVSG